MEPSERLDWEPPVKYAVDFPYNLDGTDGEGRPILIIPLGIWDIRKVIDAGEQEVWMRYYDQLFAKAFHQMKLNSKKLGREVKEFVLITDYEHLSMKLMMNVGGKGGGHNYLI